MGTIAEKLTYLNTTKTMLKDSLNKFGSSILSTDTFRSYDTKLNDIYDKLPKITQSGAGFTLENVQNGLVDDFKMIGTDLEQETTEIITIDEWEQGDINADGSLGPSNEAVRTTNYIKVFPNVLYNILRTISTSYMKFRFYDNNKNFLGTQANINVTTNRQNNQMISNQDSMELTINDNSVSYMKIADISNNLNTVYTLSTNATPSPNYPQDIKVVEGRQIINVKGKNLLNNQMTSQTLSGVTFTVNADKSITMSGTASERVEPRIWIKTTDSLILNSGETYYNFSGTRLIFNASNGYFALYNNDSITPNANINVYEVYFRVDTNEEVNTTIYPMITTINDNNYEPYYNPVGYNIDLNSENLSNGVNQNYWLNTATTSCGNANNNSGLAIDVRNLDVVEISTSETQQRYRVACLNSLPQASSQVSCNRGINKDNTSSSITINTAGYNYLVINATDLTKINVYYKYELAKIPNSDYKNRIYKNNGNWYYEKNVEKVILDGSEEWDSASSITNTSRFYTSSNALNSGDADDNNVYIMSDNFKAISWKNIYSGDTTTKNAISNYNNPSYNSGRIVIRIDNNYASTINEFKTWLSTHNVIVYYALATPVTTQITNTTLISQLETISTFKGTNIFTITNDNNIIPEIEVTRLKELERLQ